MYEIKVSTRRVTQYVIDEAYKWLYRQVLAGSYSTNRCKPGKNLMLQIEEAGTVTKETYEEFLDLFDNSLFGYMLYRAKRKKATCITTDNLYCYFVSFNDEILPLGFIKDFFEDDYETMQEVYALLEKYGANEKSELSIQWKRALLEREDAVDNVKEDYPGVLKLHPALLITQIIKIGITVALCYLLSVFLKSIDFFAVMKEFVFVNKLAMDVEIVAQQAILAYSAQQQVLFTEGQAFLMSEYLSHFALLLLINAFVTIVLLVRIKRAIRFVIFMIRVLINRIRLLLLSLHISVFEKTSIESVGNYFLEILPDMARQGEVSDKDCAGIPKSMQLYSKILRFDMDSFIEKLKKMIRVYEAKDLAYQAGDDSLRKVKRYWRKGIVMSVIFAAIVAIVNVPQLFNLVIPKILDLIANNL